MTAWQAFALGCIVTIVIDLMIRVAIDLARSRPISDPMEGVYGDQTRIER